MLPLLLHFRLPHFHYCFFANPFVVSIAAYMFGCGLQRLTWWVYVQVQKEFKGDRARKINQFATVFHLLQTGRPMLEYESIKRLYQFLKMPHLSIKHWSDNSGWMIADYLHAQVMRRAKEVLASAHYIAVTCDEVTTVDNQSWISIHAYYVIDFYRQPVLVSLERLTEGASAGRVAATIVDALATHGGLQKEDLRKKFTSFGTDGASVFQVSLAPLNLFNFSLPNFSLGEFQIAFVKE